MDNQLENHMKNHITDFICDKLKCDNIRIVNVDKYGEVIHIKYILVNITSSSKEYSPISTYGTTERELKEFIRDNKINKILHDENS